MNINGFRRWLKAHIAMFDDNSEIAFDRADETVPVIREAEEIAIELGLPDIARHCAKVTTTLLGLSTARLVLCECLAMLPRSALRAAADGMLSLREAAALLGYTEKGLRKIVARRGIDFFQSKPWAPIKFRREWVESFVENHTTQKRRLVCRPKVQPLTYEEF
jgi:hypothetical protein